MYCILIKNQKKHVFYKYLSLEAIEKGPPACYTPYKENCLTISLHIIIPAMKVSDLELGNMRTWEMDIPGVRIPNMRIPNRRNPGNHIAKKDRGNNQCINHSLKKAESTGILL